MLVGLLGAMVLPLRSSAQTPPPPPSVSAVRITNPVAGSAAQLTFEVQGATSTSCQWQKNDAGASGPGGTWADIAGATSCTSYTPSTADSGFWIRASVTATNASGSATGRSAPIRVGGEVLGDQGCSGLVKAFANGSTATVSAGPSPPTCPHEPSASADGKLIAYTSSQDGGDIFLTDSRGAWKRQLTFGSAQDMNPEFSPDGTKIAFQSRANGADTINTYDVATGSVATVTTVPHGGLDAMRFSAAAIGWYGNQIAYARTGLDTGAPGGKPWRHWWRINDITGEVTTGKTVDQPECPFNASNLRCDFRYELWAGDTQLTDTPAPTSIADWNYHHGYKIGTSYVSPSPDATKILYSSLNNGKLVLFAGGSETYTTDDISVTAWRDDGQKVFYTANGLGSNSGVWAMNADLSGKAPYAVGGITFWVTDFAYLNPNGALPPRPGVTIGHCGGSGVHGISGGTCQGDPVHSLTGAFTTSATDLQLAGIGVSFAWRRSYTSSDTTSGRLGPGWTDGFGTSLAVQANGDVILRGDEGQLVFYTKQADNSFVGDPGARSVLSQDGSGYRLVRRDQVVYLFDSSGRLTSLKDRNNQGLTFAYTGSGELQTVTDSVARQVAVTYQSGRISRVTVPDGRYVEYSYTSGRLTSVRDARGGMTQYTYDGAGRLKTIVDQNQRTVIDNTYGPTGRVTQQVDARGKTSNFAWNAGTQTSTYTDARLNAWKDVYADGLLIEQIDPLGNKTTFEYDANLNVNKVIDARGNATTMTHDARGNMLTRTAPAPLSYGETLTYNSANDPLTYRDRRGNTTDFGYDSAGNLTSLTGPDPDGGGSLPRPQTLFGRDPGGTGLLVSLTDPRGKQTTFTHANGNLTEIRTHLGNRTTMGYDGSGRVTSIVDPRGNAAGATPADFTWTYTYNEADLLRTETDPLGSVLELQYDSVGNATSRKDANLRVTSFAYNETNQLLSVTAPDPDGGGPLAAPVTQYTYDNVGNRATRKDANLRDTVYGYDTANRLVSATGPMNRVWTYANDPNGNVTQVVDANGNATPAGGDGQTMYAYDGLNRVSSIDYSDTTPDVTFAYDGNDNQTQMTDGAGTETYAYDTLDRLTGVTRASNTFSYVYDLANLTQVTYPGGTSTAYTYDDDERLLTAASAGLSTAYAYDQAGNLRTSTLPAASGLVETRTYDRSGRLVDIEGKKGATIRAKFAITRDPVGNPLQVVRTGALAQTQTYSYDAMDRLTGVCFQAGTCPGGSDPFVRWSYDGVGNRLTETRPAGTTAYTYNAADELTQSGATARTYDQNGNQLSAGSRTFVYDLANRLKTTTLAPTTTSYTYDGLGKRLQASTGTQASQKTNFLWDVNRGLPDVVLERDGNNAALRQYVYGHNRIRQTVGTASYYLYDGLGSVANTASANGSVQRTWSYEPFGPIRTQSGSGPANLWQFTGEYLDPTSLYHLRARQYDAAAGRFLSADPVSPSTAVPYVSTYAYVGNSPTTLVDPTGLESQPTSTSAAEDCGVWAEDIPFIGDEWCAGFRTLSPTSQGVVGATLTAGPPALAVAGAGTPAAGALLIRAAGTRYGSKLFGNALYHGRTGALNRGQVRIGVGRHQGRPIFRIGIRQRHIDWPRR